MSNSAQTFWISDIARAKLKRFSDQLNTPRGVLIEFLISQLELMTISKFEEQKRLLELDSNLMEKYFGKYSIDTGLDWQDVIHKLTEE